MIDAIYNLGTSHYLNQVWRLVKKNKKIRLKSYYTKQTLFQEKSPQMLYAEL